MSEDAETGVARPIRVALVDDHEIVRRGVRHLLEVSGGIEVVAEAGSAESAAREVLAARPDVVIVDLRLGDGSGIDVCREVRSADAGVATLVLTAHDDEEAIVAAVMAGAAGFVLKQVRGSRLVETVHRVAAGQSMIEESMLVRVMARLQEQQRVRRDLETLTTQESRILELIGEGMTNRQIAQRMSLAEKTVKNYVSTMLAKLGLTSRTQAAIFVTRRESTPEPPT